tara:strand:- start:608 stop:1141 length:534 start_codon:yes stop_codon:yes gene_type:complete
MASFKNSLRAPAPFKRTIKNPVTNENANDKIYSVMDNSRKLSEQKIISATASNAGPLEDSLAILSALGMTVIEETQEINTTILTDKFLDTNKLEKLTKTQDNNPNRLQPKKFKDLKTKKVSAAKLFNQTMNNSINELDTCQANNVRAEREPLSNVIEITNDFISFSPVPLITRMKIR